jgi:hypothetical protein
MNYKSYEVELSILEVVRDEFGREIGRKAITTNNLTRYRVST